MELIGKEISGAGMDPAVVGRVGIRSVPDPGKPFVNKLAVLGVTEDSYGNAVGLGNADYTTRKVANGVDLLPMYMNSITAGGTEGARMPAVLPDDRTVLQAMVATCWRSDLDNVRLCQIRSTPAPARDPDLAAAAPRARGPQGRPTPLRPGTDAVLRRRRAPDPGVRRRAGLRCAEASAAAGCAIHVSVSGCRSPRGIRSRTR